MNKCSVHIDVVVAFLFLLFVSILSIFLCPCRWSLIILIKDLHLNEVETEAAASCAEHYLSIYCLWM
jgi:hypothetical protein